MGSSICDQLQLFDELFRQTCEETVAVISLTKDKHNSNQHCYVNDSVCMGIAHSDQNHSIGGGIMCEGRVLLMSQAFSNYDSLLKQSLRDHKSFVHAFILSCLDCCNSLDVGLNPSSLTYDLWDTPASMFFSYLRSLLHSLNS
ncbi:hypothetical protein XENOCAPTIV_002162 [Xenoophorus captivus]|uniref:Uncharacterized protein n=1 Tax=Xenoophorus captivus TaxID=1517983 RepID=A0ABV0QFZ6_9TELE